MSHTPHELAGDFPEHAERISTLRQSDAHFAKLVDAYHAINRDVHRTETDVEPVSDAHMANLRKRRMALKDEIYGILSQ
ncbi:MAG: YdcH family protein [Pseudomonadota bacterium]